MLRLVLPLFPLYYPRDFDYVEAPGPSASMRVCPNNVILQGVFP
jgi:hypothetical protein